MSLKEDIILAQQTAMKSGEKEKLSILRMVTAAIKNAEIESGEELEDDKVQGVIKKQVKQLADALKDFEKGGREDLIKNTKSEIEMLSVYLPAELSDEELMSKVQTVIDGLGEGANMGQAMGAVMKELKGQADGGRVREMVEKLINLSSAS